MRLLQFLMVLSASALLFPACEDVIILDLDEGTQRIVIEGSVTNRPGPYTITVTRSAGFYEDNLFSTVSGASVIISDDLGNSEMLSEKGNGVYETSILQGQLGVTYMLEVQADGETYRAQSTMPDKPISLDSVTATFKEESFFNKEGYFINAHYNDVAGEPDYFRHKVFVNNELYVFEFDSVMIEDDNFWLYRDKYTDGNKQNYDFPHTLDFGDSVYVELHHINKASYDYYRTVVEVIDGGGVAPANPISNFGTEALGHFGAYSVSSFRLKVD